MKTCSFNGCIGKFVARGYCSGHYKQLMKGQELKPTGIMISGQKILGVESSYINGNGYRVVGISPEDPMVSMAWKKRKDHHTPRIFEHRLIMARSIGRPLTKRETVHHIDGDTLNNRIENLQLRKGKHGNGQVFSCGDCGSYNITSEEL